MAADIVVSQVSVQSATTPSTPRPDGDHGGARTRRGRHVGKHSAKHPARHQGGTAVVAPRRTRTAVVPRAEASPEVGTVRRLLSDPLLMPYHQLTALVFIVNAVVAWRAPVLTSGVVADIVLWNFVIAFGVRRQSVVNLLFEAVARAPHRWPLRLRTALARVYHHGGIHVGTTISGTLWTVVLALMLTREGAEPALLATTWTLVAALGAIVFFASPPMRHRHHDLFEASHRFGGWATLAILWVQTVLAGRAVWPLIVLSVLVAIPWLRLRRVPITVERPSDHVAIVTLADGTRPAPGAYTAVSRHPFGQWHSFALVPRPGDGNFRIIVSRAGDWTSKFIDSPPTHLWIKGMPTAGVASVATMFKSVLWVATGSGIAPVLPHLLAHPETSHLLWIGRTPRKTYGDALVDEVEGSVASAAIWDTKVSGKPDTAALARRVQASTGAEAVIVISNKSLTWQVVPQLTALGIPTFGAIWDS